MASQSYSLLGNGNFVRINCRFGEKSCFFNMDISEKLLHSRKQLVVIFLDSLGRSFLNKFNI